MHTLSILIIRPDEIVEDRLFSSWGHSIVGLSLDSGFQTHIDHDELIPRPE